MRSATSQILLLVPLAIKSTTGTPWTAGSWSLARGTIPTASVLRTPVAPVTPGQTVLLPHRQAIVDRSGVAIMGTDPVGVRPEVSRALADTTPVFQSVYTDVLLLGYLHLLVTSEIGARLDMLGDVVDAPREFHRIEKRMQMLRNRAWRIRITSWPWLNEIMHAYHAQNDISELVERLNDEIRSLGDQIERSYQHGLNVLLLLLSAIGLVGVAAGVFGAVAALMTVFGTGHWGANVAVAATSCGLLVLLVVAWVALIRGGGSRALAGFMRPRK